LLARDPSSPYADRARRALAHEARE
jgi:hypothetical protein